MSSVGSWAIVDGVFDINEFYEVIVEWFEETKTEEDKKLVDYLLLWWNRWVSAISHHVGANWKVQESVQANICLSDWLRSFHSKVCGEVAEDAPYCHYWWPNCHIVPSMYYISVDKLELQFIRATKGIVHTVGIKGPDV